MPIDGKIGAYQKMRKNKKIHCLLKSYKCVSVVYNMGILKHFVEECIGNIQYEGIGTFWIISTIWSKMIRENSKRFFKLY